MKIAIHKPDHPYSFSIQWIEFCIAKEINYIIVDCFENDIIKTLKENKATHLLWHFGQNWKDLLTARNILFSAEMMGLIVYPNKYTSWHFDDKIAQKYLLEAMDIDLVNSYVFYDPVLARKLINELTVFPVVAKLRRGSGATSVKLLKSHNQFLKYLNKMFSNGFNPTSSLAHDFLKRARSIKTFTDYKAVLNKFIIRFFNKIFGVHVYPKELGYIYFQEFVKNNTFDIRIIVIGDKAFGIKRMVRKNDFRASGSGKIEYDINQIDIKCVKKGFEVSEKLKTQSIAIDFVFNIDGDPQVIEISYGFAPRAYDFCQGFWDKNLSFHKGSYILEHCIIENMLKV